ncbi:LysE family transporter [Oceanicella actignis]|uniref:LysE family transporter n=1 Tax=Oceanicella actignis TaxID=1189325 RepID=UPI0011E65068|nr:LysE family transporter [Oceanicella actignis]TYO90741.1 threonine/homoserine/homoserine lactone efflux protein [Oceanicella actignis]
MSADAQLAPLAAFVFAGLFSPGPNVVMLAASGARFGVRATVPHILGVAGGVGAIAAAAGLGVGAALAAAPWLAAGLKAIAALWILRLAWSMAAAARRPRGADAGRPMTLAEAALFQWVNPKVWAVALAAAAGFAGGGGPAAEAARLALVFSGLNLLVCVFWTSAGGLLRRLMASERAHRRFMTALSALMAASAALIFV